MVVLLAQLISAGAFSTVPNLAVLNLQGTGISRKCADWHGLGRTFETKECFKDTSNGNHCCTLDVNAEPRGSDWVGGAIDPPSADVPWDDCIGFSACSGTQDWQPFRPFP